KATMDVAKKAWQFDKDYVNLASDKATRHIIFGEGPLTDLGGHLWPAVGKKTSFPSLWSPGKIMNVVSDIATDPSIAWDPSERLGLKRSLAIGIREGVKIKVVIEEGGVDIVTAYPLKNL
ncbi:MAG: EndoU domain-containing protein, partial [Chlamydiales bacterium]|nr:EndoU domain-containing protein [Chlamydiales bacterium]